MRPIEWQKRGSDSDRDSKGKKYPKHWSWIGFDYDNGIVYYAASLACDTINEVDAILQAIESGEKVVRRKSHAYVSSSWIKKRCKSKSTVKAIEAIEEFAIKTRESRKCQDK